MSDEKSNVEMVKPAKPMADEARWKCAGCGKEFGYSQPINFKLQLAMLKLFMDWHLVNCSSAVTTP